MRSFLSVILLLGFLNTPLQAQFRKVELVKNWDAVFVPSGSYFWNAAELQLRKLMSEEKLQEVKTFSIAANWPYGIFETEDMLDDEYDLWVEQMNKLKFETIGAITVGTTTYYLLELPYQMNLNWDKCYFWKKSLFFFYQDKYLKLSN